MVATSPNAQPTLFPPEPAHPPCRENVRVAARLEEMAELLETQGASPFRVAAYREAAGVVRALGRPASEILEAQGVGGLDRLPRIGPSLARTIGQLVRTGTSRLLDQLRGAVDPERMLASVPGLGPRLAARIHRRLGIETLEDLEAASWDGRLGRVAGLGPRRVRAIRETLQGRLARPRVTTPGAALPAGQPAISELLALDEEYLRRAEDLPHIAPHRFNPAREAWLPVLHTRRGDRHYTALYSNTARAHRLGKTHDWVVIHRDDAGGHGQWTVTTAGQGPMRGRRVVRGRESDCARHYGVGTRVS